MNESTPLAYNLTEAAEAIHVSRPTMLTFVHREDFPAFRSGRRWIIPVDALRQWLNAQAGFEQNTRTIENMASYDFVYKKK